MNIIFTDIDGVLNPHWRKKWSTKSILLYNKICNDFNLVPVITSTWRVNHTIEQLQDIFDIQGINKKIFDYTPILNSDRGLEIKTWLNNNNVTKYVVIDDKTSDIIQYVDNVIKCKSWIGLEDEHYNEIKNIFIK